MIGNELFLLKRGCGALGLDEIAKDIKEKKDNAMAMEFTKRISELLKKNGVVPKMTEYTSRNLETDKTFEARYGVTIDGLDFSEHDKVFEDRIAELKKGMSDYKQAFEDKCADYGTVSELLGKYQQENEALKKRIQELDTIDAIRIAEKRELKQHIAELESKNNQLTESILRKETKIHELESKETETCENEPKISDSAPSREWYENRHQSDCIEINRLNTTIDVLIHKVEYLRQFAGLE